MYIQIRSCVTFAIFGFCSFLTFPEGFAPDTLVRLGKKVGWQTIAKTYIASKRFIFKDPVLSCNISSGKWEAKKVRRGATVDTNCSMKLWFNDCKEYDIACAPDQKFYSVTAQRWVCAYELTIGEYLLAEGNMKVRVSDINVVHEPMRMYIINVKHNQTFVVGRHSVLTHNIVIASDGVAWIGSAVAGALGLIIEVAKGALIISSPISGPAGIVAAAGLGYIAGSLFAQACNDHKKRADYKTTARAEIIDARITSMKEKVAGQNVGGALGGSMHAKGLHPTVKKILDMQASGDVYTGYAPGPDDDKDFFEKLKKCAKRVVRHPIFKKIYEDPAETGIWWSKDHGGHAGDHYKMFIERKTGLEWVCDVDLAGRVIPKHKSPIGRFIPWKELIACL